MVFEEVPLHNHTMLDDPMRHRHVIYIDGGIDTGSFSGDDVNIYLSGSMDDTTTESSPAHNHTIEPTGYTTPYSSYESNIPPYL